MIGIMAAASNYGDLVLLLKNTDIAYAAGFLIVLKH
jgi:hypothetical protein